MTRVPNLTDVGSVHCLLCCDDGVVVVGQEPRQLMRREAHMVNGKKTFRNVDSGETYLDDVLGPCPDCEKGARLEFPRKGIGPWGSDGYWRGRSSSHLRNACNCKQPKASPREVAEWMDMIRAMMARFGSGDAPPQRRGDFGTVVPDPDAESRQQNDTGPYDAPGEIGSGEAVVDSGSGDDTPTSDTVVPVAESDTSASHLCPGYGGRMVPFSREECATCTPATEDDLIPF